MPCNQNNWPRSLRDAVERLLSSMSDAERETVRDTPETDLIKFHLGWGANIRHEFGLWHNPDLLASCGDEHPDDASMVIIHAVWESLQRGDHESDA